MTALVPGDVLDGKYHVLRQIGEGGMGTVYEGEHLRIARRVAIKVMHPEMAAERDLVQRFEREAQAAAKIGSSYVVDVLDLGELPSGERYMVMEFLEGESLSTRLRACGPMAPTEVGSIALQLLDGLAKVHDAGIVHRDLKPGNIFLAKAEDGSDFVKLLDFGICKFTQRMSIEPAGGGRLLGTLGYMSPEVMGSQAADARSDIYSIGVVLFRCATGNLPYTATNPLDLIVQIQAGLRVPISKLVPDIDPAFGAIVERALASKRDARFRDVREMRDAIARWTSQLGRVDRLLANFLDVDYVERKMKPALPPRTRSTVDVTPDTPTVDGARTRKQAETETMTRRVRSGLQPIHSESHDAPFDDARPTGEMATRKLDRSSGEVPVRDRRTEAPKESGARYSMAGGVERTGAFPRLEAPTKPRRQRPKR